ncbi:MAG: helix-turn-helix transcriptional regulator, partial [Clostridia bacterium]|nr:helix-turn-helix transcriptional regulator [Clostridia bacterium]
MEMSIGTNIKSLRQQKSVTQEQLAEAMNVTCAAVSKWERGDTFPDITLLQPLAYYFDVSIDELMGYSAHKVEQTIDDLLERYRALYRTDFRAARELIVRAHAEYPNDYRIMHCYMWNLGGDYADNDPAVLLEHKDEFLEICRKIDEGCRDHLICLDAWNMRAKILHAEGKTEEALEIYRTHFYNWCETDGQKSEQLFAKDTPEFLYWVKKNMYELADFAADKLVKSIFFDPQSPMEERVAEAEQYGDLVLKIAKETSEPFFAVIAHSLFGRLHNDLRYRGGTDSDVIRMAD